MNEVYVIAGGEWLRNNLNAIAAFMNTRTWDSIEKIALTLSVVAVAFMWVQRHNVMDLLGWVAVFVLISLLVNVRTSVQIIDNSDLVKVHRVDNVPVGLAMPLSLTTRIGHAMVNTLKPWWPGLFDGDTPRLLACGIRDVLLEDVAQRNIPLSHKKLRRALKAITRSESYLCAMKAGACRYDTEGYVTEHISQEEEAYA
ncbi:fertility inhibition protein FinO, partial [Escherichia coli]|nr:fertility inhibition protein FinO [Escherichia coli]